MERSYQCLHSHTSSLLIVVADQRSRDECVGLLDLMIVWANLKEVVIKMSEVVMEQAESWTEYRGRWSEIIAGSPGVEVCVE